MIVLLLRYYKIVSYVSISVVLLIGIWWINHKGYLRCQQDQIIQTVTVVEKRNEIANHRPDTKQFLDGLLSDKEW